MTSIGIGTLKGAWFARNDGSGWELDGPHLKGWQIGTFAKAPGGDHLLTTSSSWYGAAVHRSPDMGEWTQVVDGPSYGENGDRKLEAIWTIHRSGDSLFAGVAEAGLFRSDDDATTWHPVESFNEHETRPGWEPGFGGLAAHRILQDPQNLERMWVGVSAVGVFYSDDGGESWKLRNEGVHRPGPGNEEYPGIGYCIHCIVADPADADTIWRQDHTGVYRTTDGAQTWHRIENGLPAGFGFPIVRDAASGALFVIPLESDQYRLPVDGKFRVYRSTDGGDSWHESGTGMPDVPTYTGVLRDAMDTDGDGGVFFGTTGGDVWATQDGGDHWEKLPGMFPRINTVKVIEE